MFSRFQSILPLKKSFTSLTKDSRRFLKKQPIKGSNIPPIKDVRTERPRNFRLLLQPLGFTVLVSTTSFGACAIWQYEYLRSQLANRGPGRPYNRKEGSFREHLNLLWNHMPHHTKTAASIIALNVAVFTCWRVKSLRPVMEKWFLSTPFLGARCSSMLLSTFSHYSIIHLGINMYVLWGFMPSLSILLGREQSLAFYLSAGVVSSLCSYLVRIARQSPWASLGASGALMGVVAVICSQRPDSRVSIAGVNEIFPHSFRAGSALPVIMMFDLVCLLCGFRVLDHAAHLGGALFGLWYSMYGQKVIWKNREPFMKKWHDYRSK